MAINFPNSPANNSTFAVGGTVYTWNGYAWISSTAAGSKGQKGELGSKGDTGPKGDQGIPGTAAFKGDKGDAGPKGDVGSQGIKGDAGPKGDVGDVGSQGIKGDIGAKGDIGSQGVKGDVGPKGDVGSQGIKGDAGPKGDVGDVGQKGDTGSQGIKGDIGAKGDAGDVGQKGDTGAKGDQGIQGIKGDIGPNGDKGDQGIAGVKGDTGAKGDTGTKGDVGPAPTLAPINYAQNTAPQLTTSTSGAILASIPITLASGPAQIIASGDANPLTAGAWGRLQIYRDSTPIGGIVHYESSAGNENVPYSLQFVDAPGAGTYTYSLRMLDATHSTQFGESTGPVITVTELGNVKGDKGDGVIASIGGSNTQVIFNDVGTANGTAGFTYDKVTSLFTAPAISVASANVTTALAAGNTTISGFANVISGLSLSNSSSNFIDWSTAGVDGPSINTRSLGTKLLLYPALSVSQADYAVGISPATIWSTVPSNEDSFKFKWYGADIEVASLSGSGNFRTSGYANVATSLQVGGISTFGANALFGNNYIIAPTFKGYTEDKTANTATTGATTLDLSTTNAFDLTLTGNTTFTFTNPPASTRVYTATLILKQDDTGGRTVTWPSGTKWPGAFEPPATTSANAVDIWSLMTYDGGTTWIVSLSVKNAS